MTKLSWFWLSVACVALTSCRFAERMRNAVREHRPEASIARLTDVARLEALLGRTTVNWTERGREFVSDSLRTLRVPDLAMQKLDAIPQRTLRIAALDPRPGVVAGDSWRKIVSLPRRSDLFRGQPQDASDPERFTDSGAIDTNSVRTFALRILDRVRID